MVTGRGPSGAFKRSSDDPPKEPPKCTLTMQEPLAKQLLSRPGHLMNTCRAPDSHLTTSC